MLSAPAGGPLLDIGGGLSPPSGCSVYQLPEHTSLLWLRVRMSSPPDGGPAQVSPGTEGPDGKRGVGLQGFKLGRCTGVHGRELVLGASPGSDAYPNGLCLCHSHGQFSWGLEDGLSQLYIHLLYQVHFLNLSTEDFFFHWGVGGRERESHWCEKHVHRTG